jgi:hypothetical protein
MQDKYGCITIEIFFCRRFFVKLGYQRLDSNDVGVKALCEDMIRNCLAIFS